jgi:hypothetical protein
VCVCGCEYVWYVVLVPFLRKRCTYTNDVLSEG